MQLNAKRKEHLADAGVLLGALLFGSTFVILKDVIGDIHPVTLVVYRFGLASVIMVVVLRILRLPLFTSWKQGVVLGFFLWMQYVPQVIGLQYTSASNSAFITGLFVLFVIMFGAMFFKQKITVQKWLAVGAALGGLWLLTGGIANANPGDLITLITAVAVAIHILVADNIIKQGNAHPLTLNFQQIAFVSVLSFVAVLLFGFPLTYDRSVITWAIVYLAIFPTVLTFGLQLVGQQYTTATKVGLFFGTEPLFAALFAWTIGSEAWLRQT